jgi:hypothetical protein
MQCRLFEHFIFYCSNNMSVINHARKFKYRPGSLKIKRCFRKHIRTHTKKLECIHNALKGLFYTSNQELSTLTHKLNTVYKYKCIGLYVTFNFL